MGLRRRLRKHLDSFSSSSNSKSSSPTGGVATLLPGEKLYTDRTDIEYYKPSEIPQSKYRGRVDPLHQASLRSYTMNDAFGRSFLAKSTSRRKSDAGMSGTFSPGGTKSQSRIASAVNSVIGSRAASRRASLDIGDRAAMTIAGSRLKTESRAQSESSDGGGSSGSGSTVVSGKDDASDTPGTSLSQQATAIPSVLTLSKSHTFLASDTTAAQNVLSKQPTAHDTPFTVEELQQAMTRATLKLRGFDAENNDDDGQVEDDQMRMRMASVGRRTAVCS